MAPLTPAQAADVQRTWALVKQDTDHHAIKLFQRIFEIAPQAKALFKFLDDGAPIDATNPRLLKHARGVLNLAGESAVQLADKEAVEALGPVVLALGKRHARYGVVPAHFAVVKQALVDTLQAGLGELFTADVAEAWSTSFDVLASVMQEGMAQAVPAPLTDKVAGEAHGDEGVEVKA